MVSQPELRQPVFCNRLYVQGVAASGAMRDTGLTAEPVIANAATQKGVSDSVTFTVVWAIVSVAYSNTATASTDNDARDSYKGITVANTYSLGLQQYSDPNKQWWGIGFKARGLVIPDNFSYPGSNLRLDRDVESRYYFNDVVVSPSGIP